MPMLRGLSSRFRRSGSWTAAFFLCFLAGVCLCLRDTAVTGGVRFQLAADGFWAWPARLCLPAAGACLCGCFACGLLLLPPWIAFCGYVLSAPAALAVRTAGTQGFLDTLVSYGPSGFLSLPALFAAAALSALSAEGVLLRLAGRSSSARQSLLTPPVPLFLSLLFALLLSLSLCTAALSPP